MRTTLGSRSISSAKAWLRASRYSMRAMSVVEEVFSRAPGFGLAIDLEVNVFEDGFVRRPGALFGELHGGFGFRFRGVAEFLELRLGEHGFVDQPLFEELNGIVLAFVFLDLLFLAVTAFVFRVGDGMTVVAVGVELDEGRARFVVRTVDGLLRDRADFINVLAVRLHPVDAKSLAAFGEAGLDDGRTFETRAHRVFVVLDDVDAVSYTHLRAHE